MKERKDSFASINMYILVEEPIGGTEDMSFEGFAGIHGRKRQRTTQELPLEAALKRKGRWEETRSSDGVSMSLHGDY